MGNYLNGAEYTQTGKVWYGMGFAGGAGFANLDLLYAGLERLPESGQEIYAKGFDIQLGGGVPATMINLSRLGVPAKLLTFTGEDFISEFVKNAFDGYGVETVNLYEGKGRPVTVSSALICGGDRSFVSYQDEIEITPRHVEKVYRQLRGAKVVDMQAGFLDAYQKLSAEGTIHVFDTGWEEDLALDKYRNYLEIADYYVPNQKEALKITGESTVENAARQLGRYFKAVIIKLDKDGCLLKDDSGTKVIPPLKGVRAVDATGAGDAFMSGFLYGLYYDYPVEQCIRFGNVMGGTCVQGIGCLTQYVEEAELLRLADTLQV
ncbi:carbohydrate kinase family protein [Parablautia intestinalis]|uniref:carbohydrate kinase family protein n=1 Tax=Parablautia intestinalis TaxID=2320100 RepID=UPI00256EC3E6|nr:carbohydrate kinase family protein [Parablautia intestinalis]